MKQGLLLILIALLFLSLGDPLWSAPPEVSVQIDKENIVLGDSVRLSITVQGRTNLSPPELPPIPNFDVQYLGTRQESFSSVTVIIQGQKVEDRRSGGGTTFEYVLTPTKAGVLTIPRFFFTLGGQRYQTHQPYVITVVDVAESVQDVFTDVFVKVSVSQPQVYLGEKVLLTFELFFNRDIEDYELKVPWFRSAKDFLIEDVPRNPNATYLPLIVNGQEQVIAEKNTQALEGKRYTVLKFQKVLTPISAGTYTLDPVFLKCEVVKGYEPRRSEMVPFFRHFDFDDLFGFGRKAITETAFVKSQPVTLVVKPLPEENRPPTFSGAVGHFDFKAMVEPQTVKTGETATVTLKVVGAGNFNEVEFPPFPDPPAFQGYEPEVRINTSQNGELVIGEKIFEKVLVGRSVGIHQIPVLSFSFFDPQAEEYKTITQGPFSIQVEPGVAQEEPPRPLLVTPVAGRRGKEIEVMTQDVRYLKTNLGLIEKQGQPLYRMPLFWILGLIPLPLLTGAGFFFQRRRLRFQRDIGYARRTQAFKKAARELADCSRWVEGGASDEFYVRLSRGLRQYLADKLNCPVGTVTPETLNTLCGETIHETLLREVKESLEQMDLAKFSAAKGSPQEKHQLMDRVKRLVTSLEKELR